MYYSLTVGNSVSAQELLALICTFILPLILVLHFCLEPVSVILYQVATQLLTPATCSMGVASEAELPYCYGGCDTANTYNPWAPAVQSQ